MIFVTMGNKHASDECIRRFPGGLESWRQIEHLSSVDDSVLWLDSI